MVCIRRLEGATDFGAPELDAVHRAEVSEIVVARIARKGVESSQRLGRHRWIVEACLAWLMNYRRLVRRYERKAEHFQGFTDLACALICYRRLTKTTK